MKKRIISTFLILLTVLFTAGCDAIRENPAATAEATLPESTKTFVGVSSYGYYTDEEFLPEEIRQSLAAFGELILPEPSLQIQVYTQIPEMEHPAKGIDPAYVVLPGEELSGYAGSYIWDDRETGWEVSASYRVVAGMLTDELVKVYVDDDGRIQRYETVNRGRFDALNLDEKQIKSACLHFENAIQEHLSEVTFEFYNSRQQGAPSAYSLFMDTQGNLMLTTTAVLVEDAGTVELYAILKMGALYE